MAGLVDPADALGMCLIESDRLARELGAGLVRVTGRAFPGREHWAVFIGDAEAGDGRVLDVTARQFSAAVPVRYETDLDTWLDEACEWLGDGLDYALYAGVDRAVPVFTDVWGREDVDPDVVAPMTAWRGSGSS